MMSCKLGVNRSGFCSGAASASLSSPRWGFLGPRGPSAPVPVLGTLVGRCRAAGFCGSILHARAVCCPTRVPALPARAALPTLRPFWIRLHCSDQRRWKHIQPRSNSFISAID